MLHLLLLHSVIFVQLLVCCSKHQNDRNQMHTAEPRANNEGLNKEEIKRFEASTKRKEQSKENKASEDVEKVVPYEEANQGSEEEKTFNSKIDKGKLDVNEKENTTVQDPDYRKMATVNMTEAEIYAFEESYDRWCAKLWTGWERRQEADRKRREKNMTKEKEDIIEEERTQNSFDDEDIKEEMANKERSNKSKSKKSEKDRRKNSKKD